MTVRDILATLDPETEITLAKQNQCGLYPIIKGSSSAQERRRRTGRPRWKARI